MRCWSSITAKIISSEYAKDLSGRDNSIYTERRKKDFGRCVIITYGCHNSKPRYHNHSTKDTLIISMFLHHFMISFSSEIVVPLYN